MLICSSKHSRLKLEMSLSCLDTKSGEKWIITIINYNLLQSNTLKILNIATQTAPEG